MRVCHRDTRAILGATLQCRDFQPWCRSGPTFEAERMTLLWFIVWLIADNVGDREPLHTAPVNAWAATLILAIALDLGSAHARKGGRRR